ncbi:hypothetical protein OBBRIDRAFT_654780 [Obba rivulosa]|uniref:Uncharacterized protein n=1 Tax=Obba rivulosa TaxID=1052685 RepID=A0A8E2AUW2_9APHY|nr:hypothetical protein OBBRIDRAFT_654780 [Obba rivulosa]
MAIASGGSSRPEDSYTMSPLSSPSPAAHPRTPSPQFTQDSRSTDASDKAYSGLSPPTSPESLAKSMNSEPSDQGGTGNVATPAHIVYLPEPCSALPSNAEPPPLILDGIKFKPTSPTTLSSWRYESWSMIPSVGADLLIDSMDVRRWDSPVSGWMPCIHPEGKRYFRGVREQLVIYADQDLNDLSFSTNANKCVETLLRAIASHGTVLRDLELVIYVGGDSEVPTGLCAYYYFVTEASRAVCWLEKVPAVLVTNGSSPIHAKSQLKDAHEAQYWAHRELYPNNWDMPDKLLPELIESLCYSAMDAKTSETSTSPWDPDTACYHLAIVEKIDRKTYTGRSVCIVARLMHSLAKERFQHYHGEHWARLNRDQSVKEDLKQRQYQRSYWFLFLLWLCFYLPDQYLEELECIFVDHLVNYRPWNRFISGLKQDWADIMVPGTVLLAVNVGFLAIQSVDQNAPNNMSSPDRSVAQIASYCSTVFSLGSIVMCIILSRQHRQNGKTCDAGPATQWLEEKAGNPWHAELLTITLSLPSVWFTWGVIFFCVALLWVGFDHTSWVTRGVVASMVIPTLAAVAWVIYIDWKHKHRSTYFTGRLCGALHSRWERLINANKPKSRCRWRCIRSRQQISPDQIASNVMVSQV